MQRQVSEPIRVFLVDDYRRGPAALEALLAQTAHGEIIYVGGVGCNTSDLPDRVRALHADVVLVDLVLRADRFAPTTEGSPEAAGVTAIKALRHHCGRTLKIVAYSNWPELRHKALEAGANAFLPKGTPAEVLRETLRHVVTSTGEEHATIAGS